MHGAFVMAGGGRCLLTPPHLPARRSNNAPTRASEFLALLVQLDPHTAHSYNNGGTHYLHPHLLLHTARSCTSTAVHCTRAAYLLYRSLLPCSTGVEYCTWHA